MSAGPNGRNHRPAFQVDQPQLWLRVCFSGNGQRPLAYFSEQKHNKNAFIIPF
jgi:hypothetical protein